MLGEAQMKQEIPSSIVSALLMGRAAVNENWCQGIGYGAKVCALQALRSHKATIFLINALPPPWRSVGYFNDATTTTKADILALYDRAIDLALAAE
jgi:hypothetical protein